MKLIIEIPEDYYKAILDTRKTYSELFNDGMAYKAIEDGTPLPEWLSSFNTESAPKCFEAVQKLKMEVEDKCKW